MKGKIREYAGKEITIGFNARRCIHAAECVRGLPNVFDPEKKPWITPDGASPVEVAALIEKCPTGALTYVLHKGSPEVAPDKNVVTVVPDGPLYICGDLSIAGPDDESTSATRVALCRCGASKNKPYCDNQHIETSFADPGQVQESEKDSDPTEESGSISVNPLPNGPVLVGGPVEITGADGSTVYRAKTAFCRCGQSKNKPFCDGAHASIGFEA